MLTVLRAQGLRGLDCNVFSANSSDPFVQVVWAGQVFRSETKLGNLSPDFGAFIVPLMIVSASHQSVSIDILNENKLTSNSLLGRVVVRVDEMIAGALAERRRSNLQ